MSAEDLDCREASRLLSLARDRRLTLRQRWALFWHLRVCVACRAFRRNLRLLSELAARLRHAPGAALLLPTLSPERRDAMRAAIRRALGEG